jgi:hypothetical protein
MESECRTLPICKMYLVRACTEGERCSLIHIRSGACEYTPLARYPGISRMMGVEQDRVFTVDVEKETVNLSIFEEKEEVVTVEERLEVNPLRVGGHGKRKPDSRDQRKVGEKGQKRVHQVDISSRTSSSSNRYSGNVSNSNNNNNDGHRSDNRSVRRDDSSDWVRDLKFGVRTDPRKVKVALQQNLQPGLQISLTDLYIQRKNEEPSHLYTSGDELLTETLEDNSITGLAPFLISCMASPSVQLRGRGAQLPRRASAVIDSSIWDRNRAQYCIRCLGVVDQIPVGEDDSLAPWLSSLPIVTGDKLKLCDACQGLPSVYDYGRSE